MGRWGGLILVLGSVALTPAPGYGCWAPMDPAVLARRCPVIVTGTITAIEPAGSHRRGCDIAVLTVSTVHKNVLRGSPVEPGGTLRVNMAPPDSTLSTALFYPAGDTAVWLLYLLPDGTFSLGYHPDQRQPLSAVTVVTPSAGLLPPRSYTAQEWTARLEEVVRAQRAWEVLARGEPVTPSVGLPWGVLLLPVFGPQLVGTLVLAGPALRRRRAPRRRASTDPPQGAEAKDLPPRVRPGGFRRDGKAHRGRLLLWLGGAGLACSLGSYWPWLWPPVAALGAAGAGLGGIAWRLARQDLADMGVGLVDPAGRPDTERGRARGAAAFALGTCSCLFWGGLLLHLLWGSLGA